MNYQEQALDIAVKLERLISDALAKGAINEEGVRDQIYLWSIQYDALMQQHEWENRNTLNEHGHLPVCYPTQPAWTN